MFWIWNENYSVQAWMFVIDKVHPKKIVTFQWILFCWIHPPILLYSSQQCVILICKLVFYLFFHFDKNNCLNFLSYIVHWIFYFLILVILVILNNLMRRPILFINFIGCKLSKAWLLKTLKCLLTLDQF